MKNIIIPLLKLLFPITEGFKLDSILDFETEKRLEKREESWLLWLVDVETHQISVTQILLKTG